MNIVKGIIKWFRNQRIKNKIFIIYIPIIVLPLIFLGYFSNYIYTKEAINRETNNALDISKLIISRIDVLVTNAESCADIVMMDINRVENERVDIQEDKNSYMSQIEYRSKIENQLGYALIAFPDIKSAFFVDNNMMSYGSYAQNTFNSNSDEQNKIFDQILNYGGKNLWFSISKRYFLVTNKDVPVLTLGKKIININTGYNIGVLLLNIMESDISAIYSSLSPVKNTSYYIVDENGTIISSPNKDIILTELTNDKYKWIKVNSTVPIAKYNTNENTVITSVPFKKLNWTLVCEVPLDNLKSDVQKVSTIISIVVFLCLVFGLAGAGTLSNIFVTPIIKLTKVMNEMRSGELKEAEEAESTDEVSQLAQGFNSMIRRIKDLLITIKDEQKRKRELELALIQSQIRPHFLYNTLDLVYVLSKSKEYENAETATKSLADFYRATLSQGKEVITIEEEFLIVKNYLKIQSLRYSDVFEYTLVVDNDIKTCPMLKLTIQPLVENAIYHGLKEKNMFGKLSIKAFRQRENVLISIEDNGIGIEQEVITDLLRKRHTDKDSGAFGLNSVNERIKLFFGDEFGLEIESEKNVGTKVTIVLPYGNGQQIT